MQLQMVNNYQVISKSKSVSYDDEVLEDLSKIGKSLQDAKNGLGYKTTKTVTIQDI